MKKLFLKWFIKPKEIVSNIPLCTITNGLPANGCHNSHILC